jgi:hypothetical protein
VVTLATVGADGALPDITPSVTFTAVWLMVSNEAWNVALFPAIDGSVFHVTAMVPIPAGGYDVADLGAQVTYYWGVM